MKYLVSVVALLLVVFLARAEKAYVIPIDGEIGSTSWRIMKNGMACAAEEGADVIILRINTYGGAVDAADSM